MWVENVLVHDLYTAITKNVLGQNGEWQFQRKLHDRKELRFPCLLCKNNDLEIYDIIMLYIKFQCS